MREIKFRAWDKESEKMFEVISIDFQQKTVFLKSNDGPSQNCKLEMVEIMQYTGLKDKNEKEIYEGDILKGISEYTKIDGTPQTAISIGAVKFYENLCCFMVDELNTGFEELINWAQESIYVIGNIYENTELMKEEKE